MHDLNPNLDIWSKDLVCWERGQESGRTRPLDRDKLLRNLVEVTDILDYHNVKYWISHGTMLGFYRQGDFIPYDDDADIGLDFAQRESKELKAAIQDLRNLDYYIPEGNPNLPIDKDNAPYWDLNFIRNGEKIEGWFFQKQGDFYIYDPNRCGNDLKHPVKYYDQLGTLVVRGQSFKVPAYLQDYMVMMYSESWNIPQEGRKYNNQK